MKVTTRVSALVAAGALFAATQAHADWTGSAGYSHFSISDSGINADLGVVYATLGYRLDLGNGLVLIPEGRLGVGIIDDTVTVQGQRFDIEIDDIFGGMTRFQYEFANGAYLFAAPSYTRISTSGGTTLPGGQRISASGNSWEFGVGAGIGYRFTPQLGGEFSYESIDGEDVFNFGARFRFGN